MITLKQNKKKLNTNTNEIQLTAHAHPLIHYSLLYSFCSLSTHSPIIHSFLASYSILCFFSLALPPCSSPLPLPPCPSLPAPPSLLLPPAPPSLYTQLSASAELSLMITYNAFSRGVWEPILEPVTDATDDLAPQLMWFLKVEVCMPCLFHQLVFTCLFPLPLVLFGH